VGGMKCNNRQIYAKEPQTNTKARIRKQVVAQVVILTSLFLSKLSFVAFPFCLLEENTFSFPLPFDFKLKNKMKSKKKHFFHFE